MTPYLTPDLLLDPFSCGSPWLLQAACSPPDELVSDAQTLSHRVPKRCRTAAGTAAQVTFARQVASLCARATITRRRASAKRRENKKTGSCFWNVSSQRRESLRRGLKGVVDELFETVQSMSRDDMPAGVTQACMSARLIALLKPTGGVRSIITGTSLRTLARQFRPAVKKACAPFQPFISTRAGTDCVGHTRRFVTAASPTAGVGTYDCVSRPAMLEKLLSLPKANAKLPFLWLSYAQTSSYT